jgi:bifunctional non-homologous end joining protein LigD
MQPMLATRGEQIPHGSGWLHEVKWDGVRVVARFGKPGVRLLSRQGNDVAQGYPELHAIHQALGGRSATLDGEVICFEQGRPSFAALQHRMHVRDLWRVEQLLLTHPVTYLVFDIMEFDGHDLTSLRLDQRREVLASLELTGVNWQTPDAHEDGQMLFAATKQQELEGVVSKRLDSRYEPGVRSRHWLKFPHRSRGSYVVGGWRFEVDSTSRLGALLVGELTPQGLIYRGRVGSGIAGKVPAMLLSRLSGLARLTSPFMNEVPAKDLRGTQWVEPHVVVELEWLALSDSGRLRQPAYLGLRDDLTFDELSQAGP